VKRDSGVETIMIHRRCRAPGDMTGRIQTFVAEPLSERRRPRGLGMKRKRRGQRSGNGFEGRIIRGRGKDRKKWKMTERLRRRHFERTRCGKGHSERFK
jgi:hypothetical protein